MKPAKICPIRAREELGTGRLAMSSFYEWVMTRHVTDTPRGDLIHDIKSDRGFTAANDRDSIEGYLARRHACKEAIGEFRKLWKEYEGCLRKTSRIG